MYEQADVTVPVLQKEEGDGGSGAGAEEADKVAERVMHALARRLAESDTKQRLRTVPTPDSVKLEGGAGPTQLG